MKILPLALPLLAAGASSAATIAVVGTPGAIGATTLPSAAGTDWGYWSTSTNPAPGTATNTSSAGGRTFTATTVGGSSSPTTRGSTSPANTLFTFSNGESPAASTGGGLQVGGVFNSGGVGPANLNAGVEISLTSFTAPVRITLFTYIFESTAQLNVFLDSSSTPIYTNSILDSVNGKAGYSYTFDYTPDTTASSVRFQYLKTTSDDANSNVGFAAISITPVPEASSVALIGTAAAMGLLRRRRR